MRWLFMLAALSLVTIKSIAQDEAVEVATDDTQLTEPVSDNGQQNVTQGEAVEGEDEEATPDSDNLKDRSLGDAFRNFRPSEEISADNAVAFPVDI